MLRRDLVADGWNDRAILGQVRSGRWTRIRQGAYVDTGVWRALDAVDQHVVRTRAVVRQSRTPVVVSHISALPFHLAPMWGLDLDDVHLTRRDGHAGRREAGVRQHRGQLVPGDVVERFGMPVTSATRTALEVTVTASAECALVVVNHLLHVGATSPELLRDRYRKGIETWPSSLRTDLVLRRATAACESVGESRFWHLCATSGLPRPVPQFVIVDPLTGTVFRIDFAWPDLGVFLEFDGREKYVDPWHAGDILFREKRREDRIREITGWSCVRVTWADLRQPDHVVARVRAAFARAAA